MTFDCPCHVIPVTFHPLLIQVGEQTAEIQIIGVANLCEAY
jgi:hypothetical protein